MIENNEGIANEIKTLLHTMEQGCSREAFDGFDARVEDLMTRGNFSPDDFGFTEGKLEQWRKRACLTSASFWLRRLRAGAVGRYDDFIRYMRIELNEGGYFFRDIGTNHDEVEQLRILGCMVTAKACLKRMRASMNARGYVSPSELETFKEELQDGRLSYIDLETSAKEIAHLERASRIVTKMSQQHPALQSAGAA